MTEAVDHPNHYNNLPVDIECIDVVEHMNFNRGNAIKYLWRAGDKGDYIEDLEKAIWYAQREIERHKKEFPDTITITQLDKDGEVIKKTQQTVRGKINIETHGATEEEARVFRDAVEQIVHPTVTRNQKTL